MLLPAHPLEKETATHSSILAWRIPGTEERGRLQSMGLLRVGHDLATSLSLFTFMHWPQTTSTRLYAGGELQGSPWLNGKESACSIGDVSPIPGSGISPGEGNGNLLQYSCLENPMDGGAW